MNYKKIGTRMALATTVLSVFVTYGSVFAQTATTTSSATTTTGMMATSTQYHVMVMKHLCNANVRDISDFQSLEANKDPIGALANTVLNCPTTALPADMAVASTVSSQRMPYEFTITSDSGMVSSTITNDGMYMPGKLCESDINKDADGNGTIATSTCLDISHYDVHVMATSSLISITETTPPSGFHFGTLRFTPATLSPNNDKDTLLGIDSSNGVINLDMATDTDKTVMLHIYNFRDVSTTTPPTGTTTPPTATTTPPANQAILEMIRSIQNTLNMLQNQIQSLIMQLGANGNGNNNGNDGSGKFSNASARVASPSAVIGDTNDFAGDHFQPFEQVTMSLDGQLIQTLTSDKEGNWRTGSIRLPLIPGQKTYVFKGLSSGEVVNVNVQVNQIP